MEEVHIHIRGRIDRNWADWFAGLAVTYTPENETVLHGVMPDQSALYGLMTKLSDLGIRIVSVSSTNVKNRDISSKN